MIWLSPVIVEVCVGMEVTSYSSAEIWDATQAYQLSRGAA